MILLLKSNSKFLFYWLANGISQLSDWLRNMTLIFVVLEISNHSAKAVSFNMFMEFLPILAAPFIGVHIDRWNRKKVFQLGTIMRALVTVVVASTMGYHWLWAIFIGGFLASLCSVFISSATSGFLHEIVQPEDQKVAVSLNQLIGSIMMLLGPAVGTLIYTICGAMLTMVFSGVLLLISAIFVACIKTLKKQQNVGSDLQGKGFLEELKYGMSYSWSNSSMRPLFVAMVFIGIGAGILNALEIFIVTEFLNLPEGMLATILTFQAIGMIVSVPLISRIRIPLDKLFPIAMIITGAGMAIMVVYPSMITTVVGFLIFSFGNITINITQGTILQTRVSDEFQGRVSSLLNMLLMGSMGLAMLLAGGMHEVFRTQYIILAAASPAIIVGLCIWVLLMRSKESPAPDASGVM
jgi:DHA3 family macrolide efflux protein-like MFS transporter